MSILSAIRQQSSSIDDLAKLPQAMIMQMAQKKQIATEMVAPILARKAEMMDAVAKTKAMQGGVPQTSIMEQIIAQNSAAEQPQQMPEMENTGVAQLPVPERSYAGGGIIAFARGSLVDDDDDDDEADEMAAYQNALSQALENKSYLSNLKDSVKKAMPSSYELALAEKGQTPASVRKMMIDGPKKGDYVMPPMDVPKRGGHKYESMVIQEAQRLGIDPNLAVHVLYKETGNLTNPETARSKSGAIGVMQLMPKTAKGLGVDPLNPEENIRGGVTYLKQMYDKYQDPTLALAAYNAGPGRVDKALKSGQGISALPRETQNYVVASRMASGGEVQHFEDGGQPRVGRAGQATGSDFFPESQRTTAARKKRTPDITSNEIQKLNEIAQGYGVFPEGSSALPGENLFVSPEVAAKTDNVPPAPIAPTITKSTPEEDRYAAFFKKLDQSEANLAKQRAEDKNMALLAAGLGMLGGESPYAFANIGKGGLSGVSYLSDANKQRAAEKAALDKAYVTGLRYQELGDIAKAGKEGTIALRQGELNERIRNNNLLAVKAMRDDARAMAIAGLKQQGLIGMDLDDPNVAAKIDVATKQILSREPAFAEAYKGAYGIDFGKMQSSAMPSNVIKYDKKGKEIK
jgi:hypothetical protein